MRRGGSLSAIRHLLSRAAFKAVAGLAGARCRRGVSISALAERLCSIAIDFRLFFRRFFRPPGESSSNNGTGSERERHTSQTVARSTSETRSSNDTGRSVSINNPDEHSDERLERFANSSGRPDDLSRLNKRFESESKQSPAQQNRLASLSDARRRTLNNEERSHAANLRPRTLNGRFTPKAPPCVVHDRNFNVKRTVGRKTGYFSAPSIFRRTFSLKVLHTIPESDASNFCKTLLNKVRGTLCQFKRGERK